jgi:hypothetical protein
MILHYLSARLPKLPWLIDTIVQYGKVIPQELLQVMSILVKLLKLMKNTYQIPSIFKWIFKW